MGVQLTKLVSSKELELSELRGKVIAIDAFNTIYQFLTIIRDRETGQPLRDSKGRITSHLSGLFYRTINFLEAGMKPVYVFDGKPPEFKSKIIEERSAKKVEAEKKWAEALERGDKEEAFKNAMMSTRLTDEMIDNAKKLIELMGVPCINALSEGEAQCAYMCSKGIAWASASQDWDSLMFGSPRLIRNLSISGKRKIPGKQAWTEIKPELVELDNVLKELGINRKQLIMIGILVGTDFNPGVKGIGPKNALKIVKKYSKINDIIKEATKNTPWEGPEPETLLDFFLNPPIKDVEIKFNEINKEKILKFLVDEFEFSKERVENGLKRIETKEKSSLMKWFK